MTEYNPVAMWRKRLSPADLDVHRAALFDSLYAAGKVSEKDVEGLLTGPYQLSKVYLFPRREAACLFLHENWVKEVENYCLKHAKDFK